jgi:hypothetical protein
MKKSKEYMNHLAAIKLPKTLLRDYILKLKIDQPYHPAIKVLQIHWDKML